MIIKSLQGKTIYQSAKKTLRAALEEGVAKGADFSFADLRKAHLPNASLDGIRAHGASFWGAELCGADMGLADLRGCDFRCAGLEDVCLGESDLSGSDLRGAFFSGTIVESALLDGISVSCPSFWTLDFHGAAGMSGAVFCHRGEENVPLHPACHVIRGGDRPIVLNGPYCFWGTELYSVETPMLPAALRRDLARLGRSVESLLQAGVLHNAKKPIPKRGS